MDKTSLRVLFIILAIGSILGFIFYGYKPKMEDKKALDKENKTLQARYDDLKEKEKHRDEYIAKTEEFNKFFEEEIEAFPASLDQEISVMFMKGIEKNQGNLQMEVNSVGLGREELFDSLVGPTVTDENGNVTSNSYDCYKAAFPIQYQGSYEGIKDLMDYIMNYKYRMNITSLNINYDPAEDVYSGAINLNAYCVKGGDRQADTVTTDVQNGVSNIFIGGSGASTQSFGDSSSVTANSNDLKITLNNANNDTTPGIVITAGNSNATYTGNDVITVDVKLEEKNGKNVATITLDGKSVDVELADDASSFGIYVGSSDRGDVNDKNGIKLNVDNSTDVVVDVKVDGDDSSSPRFSLGKKVGTVKVN